MMLGDSVAKDDELPEVADEGENTSSSGT